jgi:16S rRNA (cytidine1402-2'-O)-methyltransferase
MPTLYLVGTPIGNLEDISLRAIRILREVTLIAAEDTRVTRRLLDRYEIKTRLISFHEYSTSGRIDNLLQTLETGDMALVSDAGMPGLSDPGYRLVQACIEAGVEISPIPGPTAAITALVTSGLPTESFLFLGFLPRKKEARRSALTTIASFPYTLVVFEAPHRLNSLLNDVNEILGNRKMSVGRELTKIYEETWRGSVINAIRKFGAGDVRGEITVVIAGAEEALWDEQAVRDALSAEMQRGVSRKEAAQVVAGFSGWKKRDVYQLSLSFDQE